MKTRSPSSWITTIENAIDEDSSPMILAEFYEKFNDPCIFGTRRRASLPPRRRPPSTMASRKKEIEFSVSTEFSSILRDLSASRGKTRNCVSMMKCATADTAATIYDDDYKTRKYFPIREGWYFFSPPFNSVGNLLDPSREIYRSVVHATIAQQRPYDLSRVALPSVL